MIPILTDIHEVSHAVPAAEVADVLQSSRISLAADGFLVAAGKTGRVVNLKKGQFLSPVGNGERRRKSGQDGK